MSNERLGIVDELAARRKTYERYLQLQDKELRLAILAVGPAHNGAAVQLQNPFRERIPRRLKQQVVEPPSTMTYFGRPEDPFAIKPHNMSRREVHPEARLGLDIVTVVQAVALETEATVDDLITRVGRRRPVAWPRQVTQWAIDRYCPGYSLKHIGWIFQQDHSTVMHSIGAVNDRLAKKHPPTVALVDNLRKRLAAAAE